MTTNQPQTQRKSVRIEKHHSVHWDLWVQDMLELNPNTGTPRQVQGLQPDLDQPKSHPSMCSALGVPMGATNQDAKAQQNSGNITQSREIVGRVQREAQHMDLAQHCDRNGLPEAQREVKKGIHRLLVCAG